MTAAVHKKLVIVGDSTCGKTCLLAVFSEGSVPENLTPTIQGCYTADIEVDGTEVKLLLLDTAGSHENDCLRSLIYPNTDIFIFLFDIGMPSSLENIWEKWYPEVHHFCPAVPIVLVGNKKDLRKDQVTLEVPKTTELLCVSEEEGQKMAERISAVAYLECSISTGEGVRQVFELTTRKTTRKKKMHTTTRKKIRKHRWYQKCTLL